MKLKVEVFIDNEKNMCVCLVLKINSASVWACRDVTEMYHRLSMFNVPIVWPSLLDLDSKQVALFVWMSSTIDTLLAWFIWIYMSVSVCEIRHQSIIMLLKCFIPNVKSNCRLWLFVGSFDWNIYHSEKNCCCPP